MTRPDPLDPQHLYRRCLPERLGFTITAELPDHAAMLGQDRAMEAIRFGIGIRREGFNIYALGPVGLGKHTVISSLLAEAAQARPRPSDWVYVNHFGDPSKPRAIAFPAGGARQFREDVDRLVDDLRAAVPAVFESDEYRNRMEQVDSEFTERQEKAIAALGEEASKENIALLHTPTGFSFAPTKDGEVLSGEDYQKLSKEEQERVVHTVAELEARLQKIIRNIPKLRRERRERIKALNEEFALSAVGHLIDDLKEKYRDLPEVQEHLDEVSRDVLENVDHFRHGAEGAGATQERGREEESFFRRYRANVLVDRSDLEGAPVVYEDHPTYQNLVGRVEHIAQFGALVTDFTLIKAGALHRANGGYLLLDAWKLLTQPFGWEGLKRALQARLIRTESLGQMYSLISTVSLEPEPIPLDVKVVLLGERYLYYLLYHYDPEFSELFKVAADFEEVVERGEEAHAAFARLIAGLAQRENLLPLDCGAVARVIEQSAREAGDAERLSTHMQNLTDLLLEADHRAREAGRTVTDRADVEGAVEARVYRADRIRNRVQEGILRGTVLISTEGAVAGQVNGLAVYELGNFAFAQPSRITATTRLGDEGVVDIEREANLGGAIHSKGVMIISSFLAARYARNKPLSLSASLTFEQSYGGVEGDSASLAELCALLSSLSGVPVRQSVAVTGSVNQAGEVQAIGAVNEKIEGFFDICAKRGLTGVQAVIIPASNRKHLMLREDVVRACAERKFAVYAVETVDQALELLTGVSAGVADAAGNYPRDSVNGQVVARLVELGELRHKLAAPPRPKHVHRQTGHE